MPYKGNILPQTGTCVSPINGVAITGTIPPARLFPNLGPQYLVLIILLALEWPAPQGAEKDAKIKTSV